MKFITTLINFSVVFVIAINLLVFSLIFTGIIGPGRHSEASIYGSLVGIIILFALAGLSAIVTGAITVNDNPLMFLGAAFALLLKLPALLLLGWISQSWELEVAYFAVVALLAQLLIPLVLTIVTQGLKNPSI
jgi:hypothetical protein